MASATARAASDLDHFTLEFGVTLLVLLGASSIVLIIVIVTLLRIALYHFYLIVSKWT